MSYGFDFNMSAAIDEDGKASVGLNFKDSEGAAINRKADGKDINELAETLLNGFYNEYATSKRKKRDESAKKLADERKARATERQKLQKQIDDLKQQIAALDKKDAAVDKELHKKPIDDSFTDIIDYYDKLFSKIDGKFYDFI